VDMPEYQNMKRLDQFVVDPPLAIFVVTDLSPFLVSKTASAIGLSRDYVTMAVASISLEASSYTIQNVASLLNKPCFTGGSKKNRGLPGSTSCFCHSPHSFYKK